VAPLVPLWQLVAPKARSSRARFIPQELAARSRQAKASFCRSQCFPKADRHRVLSRLLLIRLPGPYLTRAEAGRIQGPAVADLHIKFTAARSLRTRARPGLERCRQYPECVGRNRDFAQSGRMKSLGHLRTQNDPAVVEALLKNLLGRCLFCGDPPCCAYRAARWYQKNALPAFVTTPSRKRDGFWSSRPAPVTCKPGFTSAPLLWSPFIATTIARLVRWLTLLAARSIDDSIYYQRGCRMPKTRIAKLFRNGASQAVRLPVEFRFDGDEVFATRDEITGDVVLSTRPGARTWGEFFQLMRSIEVPADFMAERPMNRAPVDRDVFGDPEG